MVFPYILKATSSAPNLLSAIQNTEVVDAKLNKELAARRLTGPFFLSPFFSVSGLSGGNSV